MVKFFPQSFPKGKKMGQNPKILPQILVPAIGLEPIRLLGLRILSPVRLPIPPRGHIVRVIIDLQDVLYSFIMCLSRQNVVVNKIL